MSVSVRFCFISWSTFASTRESWSPDVIGPGADPSMTRKRLARGFQLCIPGDGDLAARDSTAERMREPSGVPSPVQGFQSLERPSIVVARDEGLWSRANER